MTPTTAMGLVALCVVALFGVLGTLAIVFNRRVKIDSPMMGGKVSFQTDVDIEQDAEHDVEQDAEHDVEQDAEHDAA